MLRRAFLQLTLAVCSLLPSRKFFAGEEEHTGEKSPAFPPDLFQVPVWSKEEFDYSPVKGQLAYCTALDIASSKADALQRHAYLQHIKQVNPELHSLVVRELGVMTQPIERLEYPQKWTDGEYKLSLGDANYRVSWRQQLYCVYLPLGPHYIAGAAVVRLDVAEPEAKRASTFWLNSRQQAEWAVREFAALAHKLPPGPERENLVNIARCCHIPVEIG
jgi:hypothetical protein